MVEKYYFTGTLVQLAGNLTRYTQDYQRVALCPLSKKRHEPSTQAHGPEGAQDFSDGRSLHVLAEHELVSHQLYQSGVYQDTSGDGVEDAIDDQRPLTAWYERRAHPEPNRNGHWR